LGRWGSCSFLVRPGANGARVIRLTPRRPLKLGVGICSISTGAMARSPIRTKGTDSRFRPTIGVEAMSTRPSHTPVKSTDMLRHTHSGRPRADLRALGRYG